MESVKIGIMPQEEIRERVLAIARGEIKPKPSDPKIWFSSVASLERVLKDEKHSLNEMLKKACES